MFNTGYVVIIAALIPMIIGRTLNDAGSKVLPQEQKAILLDLNRPYFIYPHMFLDLLLLYAVLININNLWVFYPIVAVQFILLIAITTFRARKLRTYGFPDKFIKTRTISILLQQISGPVVSLGIFITFRNIK